MSNAGRYLVLRQPNIRKPPAETADPYLGTFSVAPGGVQALSLETRELSLGELEAVRSQPDVAGMAPEMPVRLIAPTDQASGGSPVKRAAGATWGVTAVRADVSAFTGRGVVVAVLDTGIDAQHPAFAGLELVERDFTGEGNGDGQGHGTHCAGTVCGRDVEGLRIGVAPGVGKLLVGKVLGEGGGGSTAGVMAGLQWAVNEGANVISMSLGISFPHYVESLTQQGIPPLAATSLGLEAYRATLRLFDAAVQLMNAAALANDNPALLVAASGNESERDGTPAYRVFAAPPSAADYAVSVGAVDEAGVVAPFSNARPTLVAPGVDVVSAKAGGGLVSFRGTSMATPHVAGVAALYAEQLKGQGVFTPANFTASLIAGADTTPLATPFESIDVGAGLIQAP